MGPITISGLMTVRSKAGLFSAMKVHAACSASFFPALYPRTASGDFVASSAVTYRGIIELFLSRRRQVQVIADSQDSNHLLYTLYQPHLPLQMNSRPIQRFQAAQSALVLFLRAVSHFRGVQAYYEGSQMSPCK